MKNRKQRAKRRNLLRWLGIGLPLIAIIIFITSLVSNRSPLEIISGLWGNVSGYTDNPMNMNKRTLLKYVVEQDAIIDSLRNELIICNSNRVRTGVVVVDAPSLNMRDGPSLTSRVILRIPNGSKVSVNFYDTEKYFLDGIQGEWCNITLERQVGWVWGPYIKLDD